MTYSVSTQATPSRISPGRPPKAQAEARRAHLLRVATDEFLAEGFGNANVDRIARKAGVSKKTIYARYPNKEALFFAVVDEIANASHGLLAADMAAADGDPERVLLAFGLRIATTWTSPLELGIYRLILSEIPRFPSLAALYNREMELFRSTLLDYLRRQIDQGNFVIPDLPKSVRQFGLLVYGEARERALLGEQQTAEDVNALVLSGVRLFVAGYSKKTRE
ncbi:TetR/AcrR family transcriptional regulator [Pseudomonas sp. Z3-6]|uniref:TetR/AcrR family transcriptional regulator n=1 Tax=Pseudomonas sp. Z3-6 TaxID=2817411 RepID=UPI003DA908A5